MKPLPQNIEAEQSVIGACLVNPQIITQVSEVLSPADFYATAHQDIFRGLTELKQASDVVTLRNWLVSHGHKTEALADLIDIVSTSAGWRHHADIVKELSNRRKE
jgi:Replicative DNA helicase